MAFLCPNVPESVGVVGELRPTEVGRARDSTVWLHYPLNAGM